jgi:hypothetical protein
LDPAERAEETAPSLARRPSIQFSHSRVKEVATQIEE